MMDLDDPNDIRLFNEIMEEERKEEREKRQKNKPNFNIKAILCFVIFIGSFWIADLIADGFPKFLILIGINAVAFFFIIGDN